MHRGRTVLAIDRALASAEGRFGRPLNAIVSHLVNHRRKMDMP
jgi:hypothetical protein